jgi:uncharacterized protein (UPF0548 family)
MTDVTYAEVGATRRGPLPAGYRHLRYRRFVGRGDGVFSCAGAAILDFRMHRRAGLRVRASAPRAAPGVRLSVGAGPLLEPCQVVWALDGPDRAGFGYGTLPGHQASGEEAFEVVRDADGRVWFCVTSFSRPARTLMRLGGPFAVLAQHLYARLLGWTLKRLCGRSRTVAG